MREERVDERARRDCRAPGGPPCPAGLSMTIRCASSKRISSGIACALGVGSSGSGRMTTKVWPTLDLAARGRGARSPALRDLPVEDQLLEPGARQLGQRALQRAVERARRRSRRADRAFDASRGPRACHAPIARSDTAELRPMRGLKILVVVMGVMLVAGVVVARRRDRRPHVAAARRRRAAFTAPPIDIAAGARDRDDEHRRRPPGARPRARRRQPAARRHRPRDRPTARHDSAPRACRSPPLRPLTGRLSEPPPSRSRFFLAIPKDARIYPAR